MAASIEQHGPHLPTATDTIIGYALAEAVAAKLGNALVAPVIRPALSFHHIDFPGTITLRMPTFVKVLEEYCESLKVHGFKNIVLFVSHGGNADALKAFTPSIAKNIGPEIQLLFVYFREEKYDRRAGAIDSKRYHPRQGRCPFGFQRNIHYADVAAGFSQYG